MHSFISISGHKIRSTSQHLNEIETNRKFNTNIYLYIRNYLRLRQPLPDEDDEEAVLPRGRGRMFAGIVIIFLLRRTKLLLSIGAQMSSNP